MIVVNKFELYRQYASLLYWNHLTVTMTNTVIVNRFNYDFNISGSSGSSTFNITNTQNFFVNNKTNLFFQQISLLGYTNVTTFQTQFIDTNTYSFYTKTPSTNNNYAQSWSAFLTLQVYF